MITLFQMNTTAAMCSIVISNVLNPEPGNWERELSVFADKDWILVDSTVRTLKCSGTQWEEWEGRVGSISRLRLLHRNKEDPSFPATVLYRITTHDNVTGEEHTVNSKTSIYRVSIYRVSIYHVSIYRWFDLPLIRFTVDSIYRAQFLPSSYKVLHRKVIDLIRFTVNFSLPSRCTVNRGLLKFNWADVEITCFLAVNRSICSLFRIYKYFSDIFSSDFFWF
jgi:hypothetical protein